MQPGRKSDQKRVRPPRAARKPVAFKNVLVGLFVPSTEYTPAKCSPPPLLKLFPRTNAPGPPVVLAPARQFLSSLNNPVTQAVDCGTQSATHSQRLPDISKAPTFETQFARAPVGVSAKIEAILQSVFPL